MPVANKGSQGRASVGRTTVCSRAHRARPRGLALPGPRSQNPAREERRPLGPSRFGSPRTHPRRPEQLSATCPFRGAGPNNLRRVAPRGGRVRRDLRLPYDAIVVRFADGVPYLEPEAVLLFKVKAARPMDGGDARRWARSLGGRAGRTPVRARGMLPAPPAVLVWGSTFLLGVPFMVLRPAAPIARPPTAAAATLPADPHIHASGDGSSSRGEAGGRFGCQPERHARALPPSVDQRRRRRAPGTLPPQAAHHAP
jgi:hypothetical protein